MPDFDLFTLFRYFAGTVVTIYATVVLLQSLWGWYVWLAGSDRHMTLIRRYVIAHGLRLRFRTFWGDVLICLLLCVVFLLLWQAYHVVQDIGDTFTALRQIPH